MKYFLEGMKLYALRQEDVFEDIYIYIFTVMNILISKITYQEPKDTIWPHQTNILDSISGPFVCASGPENF